MQGSRVKASGATGTAGEASKQELRLLAERAARRRQATGPEDA
jgi:hypothetical protein